MLIWPMIMDGCSTIIQLGTSLEMANRHGIRDADKHQLGCSTSGHDRLILTRRLHGHWNKHACIGCHWNFETSELSLLLEYPELNFLRRQPTKDIGRAINPVRNTSAFYFNCFDVPFLLLRPRSVTGHTYTASSSLTNVEIDDIQQYMRSVALQ